MIHIHIDCRITMIGLVQPSDFICKQCTFIINFSYTCTCISYQKAVQKKKTTC